MYLYVQILPSWFWLLIEYFCMLCDTTFLKFVETFDNEYPRTNIPYLFELNIAYVIPNISTLSIPLAFYCSTFGSLLDYLVQLSYQLFRDVDIFIIMFSFQIVLF